MEDFAGIIAILMIFGIPMVAILTAHKRKMREMELNTGQLAVTSNRELDELRAEVKVLKERLNEVTIQMDQTNQVIRSISASSTGSELPRIGQ